MLEWVLSASILTLIVIGLRFLLRGKLGLRLQYALWALVLVRLLLPFSIGSSAFSAGNLTAAVTEQTVTEQTAATPAQRTQTPVTPAQNTSGSVAPIASPAQQPATILPQTAAAQQTAAPLSVGEAVRMVWLAGIGLVGLFFLSINLRFYVQVKRTRRALTVAGCKQRVYVTDAVDTPCLFGLLRPAIYVTPTVAEDATLLRHTIAHEQTHLRHGDAYWSILRGLCLALHWYNPLVWWAAFLSRRDSELACDEATVKRLGESERTAYGRTLIDMTCQKRTALLVTATTMTGSKNSLKERIILLTKKPKTAIITLLAVLLLAALAVGCTFTGAKEEKPKNKPSTPDAATVTTAPPETTAPQGTTAPPTQEPTAPPTQEVTQEWVPTEPFTPGVSLWYEAEYERPYGGLSYTGDSKRRVRIPKIEMPGPYVEEINDYIWRAYNTGELYVYSEVCDIDYHYYLTKDYLVLVIYAKDLLEENQDSDGCQAFVIDLETCREASAQEILGDMTQEEFLKQARRTTYNQFLLDYTYLIGEGSFPIESRKEYYSILNYRYEEDARMAVPVPGEDGTLWMEATILTMAGQGSRSDFLPLEIQQQSPYLEEVLASFAE